jgi:DNA-binding PadR family transcriptional regulator
MDIEKDRIVISYMRENEFIEAATYGRTPPRREAVYRISAKGLELVTDHQISSRGQ